MFLRLLGLKKFLALAVIFYIFGFVFLYPAKAGLFSFVENWLTGENADADQVQLSNSQTIPLLQAALNPDSSDATGGGDITIVGQSALLAEVGPLGSIADIEDKVPADHISIYVVREGDTLMGIAKMFDVSVNTILWANNIGRYDVLEIDQTIIVPSISGIQYEAKAGDTVESIAEKLKGDANEIRQFNDLSSSHPLAVGMKIFIPDGEAPIPPSTNVPSGSYRGGSGPAYAGYYIRPIEGGRRTQGLHGYNAIDLANGCYMPIFASHTGDIIMSRSNGWNGGYGNFVVINHPNGTQTLYAHMSEIIVGVGWHVVQGQVIGYIGATGKASGCHVHFEVRGAEMPNFY